ncbi:MAG TPA: FAD-dependent monooxygenase [Candidatus Saccharimonadales bacterium]|nr:FAD-dependent monooxygenase [Candidatus Saccharimonadales bacterium]
MSKNTTVLIVGAGPSGLMMACQLARFNIQFRIIDKNEDHTTQSRALVVQARSLEIFDQMGLAKEALEQGQIATGVGAFFNGKKLVKMTIKDMGRGLTKFPYVLMLEQYKTEKILSEFLKSRGHEVERKTELISLTQDAKEVRAVIKNSLGKEEIITAQYVVGADGAHSIVRHQLGIPFGGTTYPQSMFVTDCKIDAKFSPEEMYLSFTDNALTGFFPMTNGRYRVLGTIPKELEGKDEIAFADIAKNFSQRVHMDIHIHDSQWISLYHSHHRYAATFRQNRCFLTGDAAHIHSPVGGQGMNTGLQDAYNLAWKLAFVLQKKADEKLLDTYTDERIGVAKALVQSTDRVFSFITNGNIFIKTVRLHLLPLLLGMVMPFVIKQQSLREQMFQGVSEIGIHYPHSALSENASLGVFPENAPKPGDRVPYILFKDAKGKEINIQEYIIGTTLHILYFPGSNELHTKKLTEVLEKYKQLITFTLIPFTAETENMYKIFGVGQGGYYVIRPDMYIGYRNNTVDIKHFQKYLSQNLHSVKLL